MAGTFFPAPFICYSDHLTPIFSMEAFMTDIMIPLSYLLVIVAAAGAVIMPLVNALRNDPSSLMKSGITLVVLLVLYFLSYAISGNEVTKIYEEFGVSASGSKYIGGSLIMTYIMTVIAIGGLFVDKLMGFLK